MQWLVASAAAAALLPSAVRLKLPFGGAEQLRQECAALAPPHAPLSWRPAHAAGWDVMAEVFGAVEAGCNATLALPAIDDPALVPATARLLGENDDFLSP